MVGALDMAVKHRCPPEGVILHSDRVAQYASKALNQYKMIQSMSGKGNGYGYDNAVTVTMFKTLKTELIYGTSFADQQELRISVFEYIELFHNRKHLHLAEAK